MPFLLHGFTFDFEFHFKLFKEIVNKIKVQDLV